MSMQGRIYISGSFTEISPPRNKSDWRDNCPHFWSSPPTWGICRFDFRKVLKEGDYVFFVLPRGTRLPQMIYAYLKIKEKISHHAAFHRADLKSKRMGNKNPNGNIIVDAKGNYNRFDRESHKHNFLKIKDHFVVGDAINSEYLPEQKILSKAGTFVETFNSIFKMNEKRPIDIISRKGRVLDERQVSALLSWLK